MQNRLRDANEKVSLSMYPVLSKSYKGTYPFRLGTTSYIYPDHIIPNVKMLAPYLDEIELLLFESSKDSRPSKHEINKLSFLAKEFDLTYNIHLPIDISLGDHDPSTRRHAMETIKRLIALTSPLSPSTYTLHLSYDEDSGEKKCVKRWQELVYKSMEQLIATGIKGESISIETLTYPLEWVEEIITDLNLSVCIDIGHLILQNGVELETVFNKYSGITSIIHLHGVEKSRDHVSLGSLSKTRIDAVMGILKRFTGVVSLEVFSFNRLNTSLKFLEKYWQRYEIDASSQGYGWRFEHMSGPLNGPRKSLMTK